jgi:fructose-1,6-bisphosphatase
MAKQNKLPPELQAWADARKRFHLSHAQVQMARELGMNPKKFGGKANHKQEPWKVPLPQYIEELYLKRFKKERPDNVRSIEQMVADKTRKQAERKERRRQQREAASLET